MELIISQDQEQDSVVPIRWCINKQESEYLLENNVTNPFLLLVFAQKERVHDKWHPDDPDYQWVEYKREIIPLSDMMRYVELPRPGKTTIFAQIVYNRLLPATREERKKFRKGVMHSGAVPIISIDQVNSQLELNDHYSFEYRIRTYSQTSITVDVPEGFFAKQPPAWEKWWVNLWYEGKPVDQCHFRKRRMLAYTVQPFAVGIWLMFDVLVRMLIVGALFLHGARGVNRRAILHPFNSRITDILASFESCVFWKKKDGAMQPLFVRLLWPPGIIMAALVLTGIYSALGSYAIFLIFGLTISSAVASFMGNNASFLGWLENRQNTKKLRKIKEEKLRERERLQEYELLSCSTEDVRALAPNINALPQGKRTVKLRYQALKASVCKPFAK